MYWTGYFASHPAFKKALRTSESLLRSAQIVSSTSRESAPSSLALAEEYAAVATHHDAITGTARRRVMDDYSSRLARADQISGAILAAFIKDSCVADDARLVAPHEVLDVSSSVDVALFNPLAWPADRVVGVLVSSPNVSVADSSGGVLPLQVFEEGGGFVVAFVAKVPPLGLSTFKITPSSRGGFFARRSCSPSLVHVGAFEAAGVAVRMCAFVASTNSSQPSGAAASPALTPSGAYIFRPTGPSDCNFTAESICAIDGPIMSRRWLHFTHPTFANRTLVSDVIKTGDSRGTILHVQLGPLSPGEESSIRFAHEVGASRFFGDANGHALVEREVGVIVRPGDADEGVAIAGGVYPVTSSASMEGSTVLQAAIASFTF